MPQQEHPIPTRPRSQPAKRPSDYENLRAILDSIDADELIDVLDRRRWNGRPGYPQRAMWRAWLSKYVLSIRYNIDLLVKLKDSRKLREVCGFVDEVPTQTAMSRFNTRLADYQELVEQCFNQLTEELREQWADLGEDVAIDSTAVESYSNPKRKIASDPDAEWGVKHSARAKRADGTVYFYGYKMHTIADANHEVPLGFVITPGNRHDSPLLAEVIDKVRATFGWLAPTHLIADRGYDSEDNHKFLVDRGITPVIHIRRSNDESGLHHGLYTTVGTPTCLGQKPMVYVRTDPETGHHLYRCPVEGCRLKVDGTKAITHCDDEVWFNPADDPRVLGVLPREASEWKRLYGKRQSIERIFGSLKHSRLLEGHLVRGMRKMVLHVTMSALTYSATVLTKVRRGLRKPRIMRVRSSD